MPDGPEETTDAIEQELALLVKLGHSRASVFKRFADWLTHRRVTGAVRSHGR